MLDDSAVHSLALVEHVLLKEFLFVVDFHYVLNVLLFVLQELRAYF